MLELPLFQVSFVVHFISMSRFKYTEKKRIVVFDMKLQRYEQQLYEKINFSQVFLVELWSGELLPQ